MIRLYDLSVERVSAPAAVPSSGLRFGWKIESDEPDTVQTGYRLRVLLRGTVLYDSGMTDGDRTVDVTAGDAVFPRGEPFVWEATSRTNRGDATASGVFSTGLAPEDFSARWIEHPRPRGGAGVYFRREFVCRGEVRRAVAYFSGLGYGELYLNGNRVDDAWLDVPFTNYEAEVLYRAYDVTGLLSGRNCLGVHCGDGFWGQDRVWSPDMRYGAPCMLLELRVEYADGTTETVASDTSWRTAFSPCLSNNVYIGEVYDARLEIPGWCEPNPPETGEWTDAVLSASRKGPLKPALMPPVRVVEIRAPAEAREVGGLGNGLFVADFGANVAGVVRLHIPGCRPGTVYTVRLAEELDDDGRPNFRTQGAYHTGSPQQCVYIAKGTPGGETWAPAFSYQTFRYAEISGAFHGGLPDGLAEALVLSTDFRETGRVTTGHADLDAFDAILRRTFRSNYHGFPEDCPGREKCGWLGDAQIVSDWALLTYDMAAPYEKYLSDIRTTREVYGEFRMISPGRRGCGRARPLWGCAVVLIPYNLWRYAGDTRALADNYADMLVWMEHELSLSEDFVISEGLGDWLPPVGNGDPRRIPVPVSSTMTFYETAVKLAEIERALGHDDTARRRLAEDIKDSVLRHFYDPVARSYHNDAANAAALSLGLYPDGDRAALEDSFVRELEEGGRVMTGGIYGNKWILPLLFDLGRGDLAMDVMFGRGHASFGTMMDAGATSLWECVEHVRTHVMGKFNSVPSRNHPMHGGFAYLYMTRLAGIRPQAPGFAEFEVRPCVAGAPEDVVATFESPRGLIRSERHGKRLSVTVPANTRCTVVLPGREPFRVGSGTREFEI